MSAPRVLLVTYAGPERARGGVETFSAALAEVFPGLEILAAEDLRADFTTGRLREWRLSRALAKEAARRHRERPYDLIVANGSLARALPRPLPGPGAPVITVMHGDYAGYSRRAMAPRRAGTLYTRLVAARWERESAHRADTVVAVSEAVAKDVRRYFGRASIVIRNGVRTGADTPDPLAARRALGLSGPRPVILFVGRPTREKGFDRFADLVKARPEFEFVVASPTPIASMPPGARLFVDPDAATLASIYEAGAALFFPSRFEGCAYAPLEAMARGTPVVTSATGAFSRASGPFEGGWVVDSEDPEVWRRAVDETIRKRSAFDPAGFVRARFSFDAFATAYRDLAADLIDRRHLPRAHLLTDRREEPSREVRVA